MQDLKIGLFIVRFVDTYCEFQTPFQQQILVLVSWQNAKNNKEY